MKNMEVYPYIFINNVTYLVLNKTSFCPLDIDVFLPIVAQVLPLSVLLSTSRLEYSVLTFKRLSKIL